MKRTSATPLSKYSDIFNLIIHTLGLSEIHMAGGLYTWSNKQKFPTMEKLDGVRIIGCLMTGKISSYGTS
jgi:hypothetical protein